MAPVRRSLTNGQVLQAASFAAEQRERHVGRVIARDQSARNIAVD
jgi:hypothetical protein